MPKRSRGFTLIELMITLIVVAIGVALAVPSWNQFVEKRQVTAAAEEVASFIEFARHEAVKRNERVYVQWDSSGGHDPNWCIGLSMAPKNTPCDCAFTKNNPATTGDAKYCSIDDVPYLLQQTDYREVGHEFVDMRPDSASFGFDPVRGITVDVSDVDVIDNESIIDFHSEEDGSLDRLYELKIIMNATGRTSICANTRRSIVGGYPKC